MCGIAGVLDGGGTPLETLRAIAGTMAATLEHRGPDDGGVWADERGGLALGHRRLAVIDPSAHGHQPMVSESGRFALAYNGEIYNFRALRRRLESHGVGFRGHSDTEVLLAAIDTWGLEAALGQLNGMYAFALADRRERTVHLVRDRLGEKPLYYGWIGHHFAFASELKALAAVPGFAPRVDRGALVEFLRRGYVPTPLSIYEGLAKLEPGHILSVPIDGPASRAVRPRPYWSAREVAAAGRAAAPGDPHALVEELEALLGDAVAMRLEADVPLGVLLSGGVDSSTVAALMSARGSSTPRTFTIGSDDPAFDEADAAAAVARHLGTDHVGLRVTSAEAREVIPLLPRLYDEPFADPSQIPTFLVSRLARQDVTVCLSGDGGDELFGGYNRHVWAGALWDRSRRLPGPARRAGARALAAARPGTWDTRFARLAPLLPRNLRVRTPGVKVQKLASLLEADSADELYAVLTSQWPRPERLVVGAGPTVAPAWAPRLEGAALPEQIMYRDLVGYLPDDILVKLDRASMGVSLEARVPMLDHRVVELAWSVPLSMKVVGGTGKWILRQVLSRHVPPALFDRPKTGFGLPIGSWLQGPLRAWAEELIDPRRLRNEGYLEPEPISSAWQAHQSGRRDLDHSLWAVLMFQAWLDTAPPPRPT